MWTLGAVSVSAENQQNFFGFRPNNDRCIPRLHRKPFFFKGDSDYSVDCSAEFKDDSTLPYTTQRLSSLFSVFMTTHRLRVAGRVSYLFISSNNLMSVHWMSVHCSMSTYSDKCVFLCVSVCQLFLYEMTDTVHCIFLCLFVCVLVCLCVCLLACLDV